jgi:thioredoxin reductase (NADPH)
VTAVSCAATVCSYTSPHAWRRHTARFHSNLLTDGTSRGWRRITLLHRRAGLRETMSDYLIRDLERYGVAIRDRSEIAELHGADGELEAVTLRSGERLAFSFLFVFLGALPCTDWLADVVARDRNGFILTGTNAGGESLLETSIPGVFAAGDVR